VESHVKNQKWHNDGLKRCAQIFHLKIMKREEDNNTLTLSKSKTHKTKLFELVENMDALTLKIGSS
jgi:hypothetical protein